MKLYPYQAKAVTKIKTLLKQGERPLCYAPTGAGKTEIAGAVFAQIKTGPKVFVVHTDQLRAQAAARLGQYGVDVVTIQSLLLAPDLFREASVVCFDECHHLQGQAWREAMDIFGESCMVFGLSATPYSNMLSELFTERVMAATVQSLVKDGYIVPVSIMRRSDTFVESMQHGERINGALAYNAHFRGRQAIHFEPKISECEKVAAHYAQLGIPHAIISGETPPTQRDAQIMRFRERQIQVLISPVLLSEGFDAKCAEIVVAGRAFNSDVLLQQAVGRVRRSFEGKTEAWLLDCTGCCDGKTPDYFNSTDESLFAALSGPAEGNGGEGRGAAHRGSVPDDVIWVECDAWDVQQPDLSAILQRAEYADILEAARVGVKVRAEKVEKLRVEKVNAKSRRARARERAADPEGVREKARHYAKIAREKMSTEEKEQYNTVRRIAGRKTGLSREEWLTSKRVDPTIKAERLRQYREHKKATPLTPEQKQRKREIDRKAKLKYLSNPDKLTMRKEYERRRNQDPTVKSRANANQAKLRNNPTPAILSARERRNERDRARRAAKAAKK